MCCGGVFVCLVKKLSIIEVIGGVEGDDVANCCLWDWYWAGGAKPRRTPNENKSVINLVVRGSD